MILPVGCPKPFLSRRCISLCLLLFVLTQTAFAQTLEEGRESPLGLVEKGVLLPVKKIEMTSALTYGHFSRDNITINGFSVLPVLVVGVILSEQVQRDILIPSLTLRYGLLKDVQGELVVPGRYQTDRRISSDGAEKTDSDTGIGDLEMAGLYQILHENETRPHLLFGLRVKTRTGEGPKAGLSSGTGFYGLRGHMTMVKTSDPAVLFGGLGYTYNIPRNINDVRIDPGDTIELTLGTAYAISAQISLSLSFEERVTLKTKVSGRHQVGTLLNVAQLGAGITYSLKNGRKISFSVGEGLARDAPDFVMQLGVSRLF